MKITVDPRIKIWYVAFTDNAHYRFWFSPLLRKGFAHCYAFTFDLDANRWILYDPTWSGTTIRCFTQEQMEHVLSVIRSSDIILKVRITDKPFKSRHLQTCASLIGNLIGVNLLIPSPYRLFCALKKLGGEFSFLSSVKMENEDHGRYSKSHFRKAKSTTTTSTRPSNSKGSSGSKSRRNKEEN